ncbi:MAG: hypothetical protein M3Z11_05370 [Candidatus Dormibacteraeota bacterium]|nr:hypothetical protein [Candidatus Dormibacteraeota bacterium]
MSETDHRSFKVALVADQYVNPPAGGIDAIAVLFDSDWGVIQLPSDTYGKKVAAPLLAEVAEQAQEFYRRGYDLVLIGERVGLDEALAAIGIPRPARVKPASARALRSFLQRRPRPAPGPVKPPERPRRRRPRLKG